MIKNIIKNRKWLLPYPYYCNFPTITSIPTTSNVSSSSSKMNKRNVFENNNSLHYASIPTVTTDFNKNNSKPYTDINMSTNNKINDNKLNNKLSSYELKRNHRQQQQEEQLKKQAHLSKYCIYAATLPRVYWYIHLSCIIVCLYDVCLRMTWPVWLVQIVFTYLLLTLSTRKFV